MNQPRFAITVSTGLDLSSGLAACGAEPEVALSPKAADGASVARQAGCLDCHITDGSRGAEPAFAGLMPAGSHRWSSTRTAP